MILVFLLLYESSDERRLRFILLIVSRYGIALRSSIVTIVMIIVFFVIILVGTADEVELLHNNDEDIPDKNVPF